MTLELEVGKTQLGRVQQAAAEQVDWPRLSNKIAFMLRDRKKLEEFGIPTDSGLTPEDFNLPDADFELLKEAHWRESRRAAKLYKLVTESIAQHVWAMTFWTDRLPHGFAITVHKDPAKAAHGLQAWKVRWERLEAE